MEGIPKGIALPTRWEPDPTRPVKVMLDKATCEERGAWLSQGVGSLHVQRTPNHEIQGLDRKTWSIDYSSMFRLYERLMARQPANKSRPRPAPEPQALRPCGESIGEDSVAFLEEHPYVVKKRGKVCGMFAKRIDAERTRAQMGGAELWHAGPVYREVPGLSMTLTKADRIPKGASSHLRGTTTKFVRHFAIVGWSERRVA